MNATISIDSQTATSQLLIGVATDVHYLANCSWTVAMVYTQHQNLHPVCLLGEQIDLTLCRERSLMALADAESHGTASCICRYAVPGIPELLFRIRVSGMTVAVIA
ncbi:MAG: hypothetical protein H7210_07440, partial [Pyrinomonadaceae bacterium]|nr:hypothetical protein [Phycisphaerales bacterium]